MDSSDKQHNPLLRTLFDILASEKPKDALKLMSEYVLGQTQSTSMAIYFTIWVHGRESVKLLYDSSNPDLDFPWRDLFADKGICEWVLRNNQWVIGEALNLSSGKPDEYTTQNGDKVQIQSSTVEDWSEPFGNDEEWGNCFIPFLLSVKSNGHIPTKSLVPNAVLALNRDRKKTYTSADVTIGLEMLPAIRICCEHFLALTLTEQRQKTQKALLGAIDRDLAPYKLKRSFVKVLLKYYSTRCILTLNKLDYDHIDKQWWYIADTWTHKDSKTTNALSNLAFDMPAEIKTLADIKQHIRRNLQTEIEGIGGQIRFVHLLPAERTAIVVLDHKRKQPDIALFEPDGRSTKEDELVDYVWPLYRIYKQAHLRKGISKIQDDEAATDRDIGFYTKPALETLLKATKAELAFVFLGSVGYMEVKVAAHKNEDGKITILDKLFPKKFDLTGTLAKWSIDNRKTILIPDINIYEAPLVSTLAKSRLKELVADCTSNNLRSWLCCPIAQGDEKFGAIMLLTTVEGKVLSRDAISICEGLSDYIYTKHKRFVSEHALLDLNRMTNELVTVKGDELTAQLVEKLENWSKEYVNNDTQLAISASTTTGELFGCASTILTKIVSREDNRKRLTPDADQALLTSTISNIHFISFPIKVAGVSELSGFISFWSKSKFTDAATMQASKAVDSISLIIYQEYLRDESNRELARFRHAIVAPIQGLVSWGKKALRVADTGNLEQEKPRILAGIARESNVIENWFNISKMLSRGNKPALSIELHNIESLIDDGILRYQEVALKRGIQLSKEWHLRPGVGFDCDFDTLAMDIAISNLIDNAVKYSYSDSVIRIEFTVKGSDAVITVTNTGRSLPEDFQEHFNGIARFDWRKQSNIVAGQRQGISIIRSLIEAHDGELHYKQLKTTSSDDSDKVAYQVSFELSFPHGVRKNK